MSYIWLSSSKWLPPNTNKNCFYARELYYHKQHLFNGKLKNRLRNTTDLVKRGIRNCVQSQYILTCFDLLRGLVKLKQIQKSEKHSDWSDTKHPPPYPFFFETFVNMKTTQKSQNPLPKKNSWGLTHPPGHFRVFLGFLDFFQLDKTP